MASCYGNIIAIYIQSSCYSSAGAPDSTAIFRCGLGNNAGLSGTESSAGRLPGKIVQRGGV